MGDKSITPLSLIPPFKLGTQTNDLKKQTDSYKELFQQFAQNRLTKESFRSPDLLWEMFNRIIHDINVAFVNKKMEIDPFDEAIKLLEAVYSAATQFTNSQY